MSKILFLRDFEFESLLEVLSYIRETETEFMWDEFAYEDSEGNMEVDEDELPSDFIMYSVIKLEKMLEEHNFTDHA
jgi:hypothetical protein